MQVRWGIHKERKNKQECFEKKKMAMEYQQFRRMEMGQRLRNTTLKRWNCRCYFCCCFCCCCCEKKTKCARIECKKKYLIRRIKLTWGNGDQIDRKSFIICYCESHSNSFSHLHTQTHQEPNDLFGFFFHSSSLHLFFPQSHLFFLRSLFSCHLKRLGDKR